MKPIYYLIFVIALVTGMVAACEDDCPTIEKNERGTFQIVNGDNLISSGTIEVQDTEVEIVYPDTENNEWHVIYRIVKEE